MIYSSCGTYTVDSTLSTVIQPIYEPSDEGIRLINQIESQPEENIKLKEHAFNT